MSQKSIVRSYLIYSIIAAVLILILVLASPLSPDSIGFSEKLLLSSVFIMSCAGGISFSLYPNWIRKFIPIKKGQKENNKNKSNSSMQGHHPDCGVFEHHTVYLRKKHKCAGCLGLSIGLFASIFLMVLYLSMTIFLPTYIYYLGLLFGFSVIALTYLDTYKTNRQVWLHISLNILLAPSFFLITVSVMSITGEVLYGLFTIMLCWLWVDARIQLSKLHHRKLCAACTKPCKIYDIAPSVS